MDMEIPGAEPDTDEFALIIRACNWILNIKMSEFVNDSGIFLRIWKKNQKCGLQKNIEKMVSGAYNNKVNAVEI